MTGLRTEFEFALPKGYVDDDGTLHRRGRMRLATARDELEPLRDPSINGPDDPYLTVLVLSRVVTHLGSLPEVTTRVVEGLFAVDLAFLQDVYGIVNFGSEDEVAALVQSQRASVEESSAAAGDAPAEADDQPSSAPANDRPLGRRAAVEEVRAAER